VQKINRIAILAVIFIGGCGTTGKVNLSESLCGNPEKVIEVTTKRNLSEYGFYIQKGKLSIEEGGKKTKLLFTMKYIREENYLISVRSETGIEALRVMISKDTLLVNDRINREVLYGNPEDFRRISGIPADLLKICVGDIAGNDLKLVKEREIKSGIIDVYSNSAGIRLVSSVDCKLNKVRKARIYTDDEKIMLELNYSDFRGTDLLIPGSTNITDSNKNVRIKLNVRRFIIPWHGDLEFYPGTGFTRKRI